MNIILFDDNSHQSLLPLTYTKPVAALRVGILTIKEKWDKHAKSVSYLTQDYLSNKYRTNYTGDNFYINGSICPTKDLIVELEGLGMDEAIFDENQEILIAYRSSTELNDLKNLQTDFSNTFDGELFSIRHTWDIFSKNEQAIQLDFLHLTEGRTSAKLNETNTIIGNGALFIEEGAEINCAIFNTTNAYIYIGKDTIIMEGSLIRGSLALCEGAQLKLGAKIYGATTIGPHSKVGGEVNNSVIQGYSNKGHDGFIGNTVIGEWCNLGADTNTSNLKNNYANVRLWDYESKRFADTGLQFCGLVMGDHSKCGINTMFNTGTVVGVSANIFGSGFPRNFIPSFSWGGATGQTTYQLNKVFEVAEMVMSRRGIELDEKEKDILTHIFNETASFRSWENK